MNAELVEQLIAGSPLASHLGMKMGTVENDRATIELPFSDHVVTIADIVHGGAISALIDTAATAAAWATDEIPENMRGTTVALTVNFVSAAKGSDLTADAKVIKRGRSLCYIDVEVKAGDDLVAKGISTYKLG